MKYNKILAVLLMAGSVVSFANVATAADGSHGTVKLHGFIIDAPCSIDSQSVDQTVELGDISSASLKDGGNSTPSPFTISLKNCSLDTANTVTATFTGAEGANGNLGITGDAKGASIVLTDGAGTKIVLGEATSGQALQDGDNSLMFSAYLQGDGASSTVTPGEFTSITDFTLAYE